jgi:signal transduction histidine kinase
MLAEQGYVVEERTSLVLDELASEAWDNVDTREAQLDASGTTRVFGERKRLLQIFENLFRNAVEHGGADVTVRVRPIELFHTSTRGGDQAESDGFIVEDDGEGLPDDPDLDLFESGASTSGSGLGLTIAERIIDAHGWEITAGEAPRGGAQFKITAGEKAVMPFR